MEFRLYSKVNASGTTDYKVNCSLFDLVGNKEPDQTKGLGYLLAKSRLAMEFFLNLLGKNYTSYSRQKWIVDCELIQGISNNKSLRADIILWFYNGFTPIHAIIIEAKTANGYISNSAAAKQVAQYCTQFKPLKALGASNITMVTLTTAVSYQGNYSQVKCLTWQEIRTAFSSPTIRKSNSYDANLISDYINYINHLQNTMNYYDEEILSIPAGGSINSVKQFGIYECPITGKYKSRGEKHPLYVAFRNRGQKGRIDALYKIQEILMMDLDDQSAIDAIDSTGKYPNFKQRIEGYKNAGPNYLKGTKWVFILDQAKSFNLPYPVEYAGSIRGMAGTTYLTLAQVLQKPQPNSKVVLLQLKKNTKVASLNTPTP